MAKTCTKCDKEYPATAEYFYRGKSRKEGLRSECKKCSNLITIAWREKNPEKHREYNRKYRQRNLRKCQEKCQKYYQDNPEWYREYIKTLRGYVAKLVGSIKWRCTNPKAANYEYYGGCGIKLLFNSQQLYDWLIRKNIDPRGLEIHRIDNSGNYTLNNITFLTRSEHVKLHTMVRI